MKIAYGYGFPDEVTDLSIELHFYRKVDEPEQKAMHLEKAWRVAFPEKLHDGKPGYIWSPWTTRRIRAWCGCDDHVSRGRYQTWWGPSASGKTEDAGILCLLHWLSAPDETTIHLTSTSGKMLKRRIWGTITKYYLLYGEGVFPGQLKVAENAIVFSEQNLKAGIFGHAVERGEVDKAISNIIGMHSSYNALILDEMQGTPEAVGSGKVLANLSIGKEFKFLGMGNPISRLDLLGQFSEPVMGWDNVGPELEKWETKRGYCYYFDGLKSPGVDDPARYPFLLKQNEIDETKKNEGEGSPDWWTMRRGFMPPEGLTPTMITESLLVAGECFRKPQWGEDGYQIGVAVDPAYSSKGDRCIIKPFQHGYDIDGKYKIEFLMTRPIQLKLAKDITMLSYISENIVRVLMEYNLDANALSMDCTGMQGTIADKVEELIPGKVFRVYFGGKPNDDFPISAIDHRKGSECYKNRVTQLMGHFAQYAKSGMIRGVDRDTANELCARQLAKKVSPMRIESKDDYKARMGFSPDISDAGLVGIAYVREKLYITPEGRKADAPTERQAKDKDVDGWDDNWLNP